MKLNYLPALIKAVPPAESWWSILALLSNNNRTISLCPSPAAKNKQKSNHIQNTEQMCFLMREILFCHLGKIYGNLSI